MTPVDASPTDLQLATAIVTDARGQFLTVRKRHTHFLLQPGGKIQPGERPEAAMRRELKEELDVSVDSAVFIARISAPAANEPGLMVTADVFTATIGAQLPRACAEIAELVWIDPAGPRTSPPLPYPLAELTHRILSLNQAG